MLMRFAANRAPFGIKTAAALCAMAICVLAADDPFSGTWKLSLSKSRLTPPVPQSQTVQIEADATGVRFREDIVSDKGEKLSVTADAKFDGKDYPVIGSPIVDTVAYRRVNARTIKGTAKKAGQVAFTETVVVSKDGKTMTSHYSGKDAAGKPISGVAVLEKQ
jgi:hypothetical protein